MLRENFSKPGLGYGTFLQTSKCEVPKTDKLKSQEIRSDRLKKDITITTQEKIERMATKRNLEGNTSSSTMFSDLRIKTIKDLSSDIGINVHQISFGTFDMLKELEIARKNLQSKQHEVLTSEQAEEDSVEKDINDRLIEWLQDEHSETESAIMALSKKKGRLTKIKLKISPKSKTHNQDQEAPGLKEGGKRR